MVSFLLGNALSVEDESILTIFPSRQESPTCPLQVLAAKVCDCNFNFCPKKWPTTRTFEVSKLSAENKNMAIVNLPPPHVTPLRKRVF